MCNLIIYSCTYLEKIRSLFVAFTIALVSIFLASQSAEAQFVTLPNVDGTEAKFPHCDSSIYMAAYENNGTKLQRLKLEQTLSYVAVGSPVSFKYNAMAYNSKDDYIYAVVDDSGLIGDINTIQVVRIDANGVVKHFKTVVVNGRGSFIFAGEFANGIFYFIEANSTKVYKVDLFSQPTPVATNIGDIRVGISRLQVQDIALYDNSLWGIVPASGSYDYRVIRIDLQTDTIHISDLKPKRPSTLSMGNFTSMFGGINGVYGYNTGLNAPAVNGPEPNFVKLHTFGSDLDSAYVEGLARGAFFPGSDGAKCPDSPIGLPAEIVVEKTSSTAYYLPGSSVTYNIKVTNNGPWGASGIKLTDPVPSGGSNASWSCSSTGTLAACAPSSGTGAISSTIDLPVPGETIDFTLTMQTNASLSNDFLNTASIVVPEDFEDSIANNKSTFTMEIPRLNITMNGVFLDDNGNGSSEIGEKIEYTFVVKNETTFPLTGVNVVPHASITGVTPVSVSLASGASTTFTGFYTLTAADIAAGEVTKDATAKGMLNALNVMANVVQEVVPLTIANIDYTVMKTGVILNMAEPSVSAGDKITYTVKVKNTGTGTMTNVSVTDPGPSFGGQSGTGQLTAFLPATVNIPQGGESSFVATYTITEQDLSNLSAGTNREVTNIAKVRVDNPLGGELTKTATSTLEIESPGLKLEKTGIFVDILGDMDGDGNPIRDVGDRIEYIFTVTNTGSSAISDILVTDDLVSAIVLDPNLSDLNAAGELGPGGKAVFFASYTLTQDDINRGEVVNIATVSALQTSDPSLPPLIAKDTYTEIIPGNAFLLVEKKAEIDTEHDDGDGFADAGDRIRYTVTLKNAGNVNLKNAYPIDNGPIFNGRPGTGYFSDFVPGPVDLKPGDAVDFVSYYTLSADDIQRVIGVPDGIYNVATANASLPDGEPADLGLPAEAVLTLPSINVTKRSELRQVTRGGMVPFVIEVKPAGIWKEAILNLVDTIPVGFSYVSGSARVNGKPIEPDWRGRNLTFPLQLKPGQKTEINLMLAVSAAVSPGRYDNLARAVDRNSGEIISGEARATIEVVDEPVFDCSGLLGSVFDDKNRNGFQDNDEAGVAGAKITTADGVTVTSDGFGRFNIGCADISSERVGSNFVLKLDPRSLPTGYRIISENPQTIRLTRGKLSAVHFATSIMRTVRVDISSEAFLPGKSSLRDEWIYRLHQLIDILKIEPSVLNLSYADVTAERSLSTQRLGVLRSLIGDLWKSKSGRYRLEIETRINSGSGSGFLNPQEILTWHFDSNP